MNKRLRSRARVPSKPLETEFSLKVVEQNKEQLRAETESKNNETLTSTNVCYESASENLKQSFHGHTNTWNNVKIKQEPIDNSYNAFKITKIFLPVKQEDVPLPMILKLETPEASDHEELNEENPEPSHSDSSIINVPMTNLSRRNDDNQILTNILSSNSLYQDSNIGIASLANESGTACLPSERENDNLTNNDAYISQQSNTVAANTCIDESKRYSPCEPTSSTSPNKLTPSDSSSKYVIFDSTSKPAAFNSSNKPVISSSSNELAISKNLDNLEMSTLPEEAAILNGSVEEIYTNCPMEVSSESTHHIGTLQQPSTANIKSESMREEFIDKINAEKSQQEIVTSATSIKKEKMCSKNRSSNRSKKPKQNIGEPGEDFEDEIDLKTLIKPEVLKKAKRKLDEKLLEKGMKSKAARKNVSGHLIQLKFCCNYS